MWWIVSRCHFLFRNRCVMVSGSACVLLFLLADAIPHASAGLLFKNGAEPFELIRVDPDIVLRQRAARIDYDQIPTATVPETLIVNFFGDIALQATLDNAKAGSGAFMAWRGRFEHDPSSVMTLVRRGDAVAMIAMVGERRFDVRSLGDGIHIIQEIALHRLRSEAGDENRLLTGMHPGAEAAVAASESTEAGMNDPAWQVFVLTNQERAKYSLAPFQADARLVTVAQTHSQAQADAGDLFHTANTAQLYAEQGYVASGWAENVAYGSAASPYATPEGVLLGWMNSPGHRQNLLSGNCDLGVGNAVAGNGDVYWTQNFATEQGDPDCLPSNPDTDTGPGDDTTPGDDTNTDDDSSHQDSSGTGCFSMVLFHPTFR